MFTRNKKHDVDVVDGIALIYDIVTNEYLYAIDLGSL